MAKVDKAALKIARARTFSDVALAWLQPDGPIARFKPRTQRSYRLQVESLVRFFGPLTLGQITGERMLSYQRARAEGLPPFRHPRLARHVNSELSKLQIILDEAGAWKPIKRDYKPLPICKAKRRQMTEREQAHLLAVAQSNPQFAFCLAYMRLSISAGIKGREMLGLRIADVDLVGRTLRVGAAHWRYDQSKRFIALANDAVQPLAFLLERANRLGAVNPNHFLFPFKSGKRLVDPTMPMTDNGIVNRWNALRKAAGMPWAVPSMLLSVQEPGEPVEEPKTEPEPFRFASFGAVTNTWLAWNPMTR